MNSPVTNSEPAAAPVAMGAGARITYRSIRMLISGWARLWLRLSVSGAEHVPATGAYVLALGGHRSILDTPVASLAGGRILRYMGAENYFGIPVLGSFLRAMGGFAVERGLTDRAALRAAESILSGGEPLVIFPEGTRQEGPNVQPLKEGAAFLACRAQVPIVPVGIGGAARAMPKGARWIRPSKVSIVIGPPIKPPAKGEGRVKRSAVSALNDELHVTLQALFDEAQTRAKAP